MNAPRSKAGKGSVWERQHEAELQERRRRFSETTPGERLEQAFELSELSRELRAGVRDKQR